MAAGRGRRRNPTLLTGRLRRWPTDVWDHVRLQSVAANLRRSLEGIDVVVHTATLQKPHVGNHSRRDFVDANVSGTLNRLEEAADAGVGSFVFTSTTSTFGRALNPPPGEPAAWITEDVAPVPSNIYGVTKAAAEDLCELVARDRGLPCVILRTSRFFPEADDRDEVRAATRRQPSAAHQAGGSWRGSSDSASS